LPPGVAIAFPPRVLGRAVWLYYVFNLSLREVGLIPTNKWRIHGVGPRQLLPAIELRQNRYLSEFNPVVFVSSTR
jgi:hypothetical protein